MQAADFAKSPSGKIVPTIADACAFVPNELPPKIQIETLLPLLTEASMSLGELKGIGRTLPNPYLLIRPFQKKEAVSSSNIEGTHTSLSDLFLFEAGADEKDRPPDTREVHNYARALDTSIQKLKELPVCLRLIREAHEILLQDVQTHRGAKIYPGEFRKDQNWIGGRTVDQARFVPSPPNEMMQCLDALEKYIHDTRPQKFHTIVDAALIHYQFEAIHPFPDGNGRVGRLLIPLLLCERQVLPQPLLYLSPYFERHKDEYIDRLYAVSKTGDWLGWIEFFIRGVLEQSQDTIARVQKLQGLQATYRQKLQTARSSALPMRLMESTFESPFLTIPQAQKILNVTYRSAQQNVEKLVRAQILKELPNELRPKFFYASEVFSIIHSEKP